MSRDHRHHVATHRARHANTTPTESIPGDVGRNNDTQGLVIAPVLWFLDTTVPALVMIPSPDCAMLSRTRVEEAAP